MKPYQKLQRHWRDTDATISTVEPGEEAVGRLEEKYGIRFPDDFRDYLLHSCPKDGGWDGFTSWWCLERLKNVAEECVGLEITDAIIVRDAANLSSLPTTAYGVLRGRLIAAKTRIGAAWS